MLRGVKVSKLDIALVLGSAALEVMALVRDPDVAWVGVALMPPRARPCWPAIVRPSPS